MRRIVWSLALVLMAAGTAQALTVRDVIELTKAGTGEQVLLALIEVDGSLFNIDRQTLNQLEAAGVSEKVIVALIRSGRTNQTDPALTAPQPMPQPETVYVPQPGPAIVQQVAVPVLVPVYVPIAVLPHGRTRVPRVVDTNTDLVPPSITAPIQLQGRTRFLTDTPPPPREAEPVYWGWGGKLRPDAWKPK